MYRKVGKMILKISNITRTRSPVVWLFSHLSKVKTQASILSCYGENVQLRKVRFNYNYWMYQIGYNFIATDTFAVHVYFLVEVSISIRFLSAEGRAISDSKIISYGYEMNPW